MHRHQILLADHRSPDGDATDGLLGMLPAVMLTVVPDGRAVLEAAMARPYDLLIVRGGMPLLGSDRVLRHLRASNGPNTFTPVIHIGATAEQLCRTGMDGMRTIVLPRLPCTARARLMLAGVVADLLDHPPPLCPPLVA